MGSIREELLIKAQRDKSKLVQVQRTVSRGGKTFTQNFWVKPSEVKSTDKVVGGQQNLLPTPGSVAKPAAGVLDKAYFDSLKSDKTKALDYLKSCGISWQEHNHAGINWMRAMQAFSSALGAQGSNKNSPQVNSQQTGNKPQSAQNNQSGNQASTITLTKTQKDELDSGKNGREKVVILKKLLGADGCASYAKQLGVTWEENAHAAVNWMRIATALREHFDSVDGTTSPVGASKGNQNAKGADPDKLKIPANATPRQTNIINLLNNITSEADLETYTSVGMIPEDDVAKAFILEKLAPKYAVFAAAHLPSKGNSSSKSRHNRNHSGGFADEMAYRINFEGCKKDIIGGGLRILYDKFNMALITDPRSQLSVPFGSYRHRRSRVFSTVGILQNLNTGFAYYTTDEFSSNDVYGHLKGRYMTNLGYTGRNPLIYHERYDLEKEGFVRVLRTIAQNHTELDDKCEEMIDLYDEIMLEVGGNPYLLDKVLTSTNWGKTDSPSNKAYDFGWSYRDIRGTTSADARETIRCIDLQYHTIVDELRRRGLSDKAILNTLSDSWYNDDLRRFRLKDDNNDTIETIDIIDSCKNSLGLPILNNSNEQMFSSGVLRYIRDRFNKEEVEKSDEITESMEEYEELKQVAEFTEEQFLKVHSKVMKLFGLQVTKTDMNSGNTSVIDLTKVDAKQFGVILEDCDISADDSDRKLDAILTNLSMIHLESSIKKEITGSVANNTRSKLNNNGSDYSGNYDYYYPTRQQQDNNTRRKQYGGGSYSVYTADELNFKINQQLSEVTTFSPSYIEQATAYYNAKSNFLDATEEAKKATFGSVGIELDDYVDSPLKDVLYSTFTSITRSIPRMSEGGKSKVDSLIAKKMDYVPYDFTAAKQRRLSDKKPSKSAADKTQLRKLREEAYKAIHCTIETEPADVSLQMRKDFLRDWDYRDDKTITTPDGIAKKGRMYSGPSSWGGYDRRALFNSRFFKVKNSNMEDDFTSYQTELKSDSTQPDRASEALELYHACGYASVAGILGKTGGWFMGNQYTKVAKALGNGAYFGFKGAKSSVYCGEGSGGYHNTSASGADGDNANGCYILATVMRGKSGDSQSDNGRFRDYEIAVKNNKCIFPHHFVDISARSMDVNVKRDTKGNYTDLHGNITHDRYGQKIDMK